MSAFHPLQTLDEHCHDTNAIWISVRITTIWGARRYPPRSNAKLTSGGVRISTQRTFEDAGAAANASETAILARSELDPTYHGRGSIAVGLKRSSLLRMIGGFRAGDREPSQHASIRSASRQVGRAPGAGSLRIRTHSSADPLALLLQM